MNYTIADYDLKQLGRGTFHSIQCKVKGYWSRDTITIYIERGWNEKAEWKCRISYGSGGRDTKEVVSDMEAGRYFAEALTAMCNLADEIITKVDILEASYQEYKAEVLAECEREKAEKQAKIDADEKLGKDMASFLLNAMLEKGDCSVNLFERGSDRPTLVQCIRRNKTTFYIGTVRKAKGEVLAALEKASIRTGFAV